MTCATAQLPWHAPTRSCCGSTDQVACSLPASRSLGCREQRSQAHLPGAVHLQQVLHGQGGLTAGLQGLEHRLVGEEVVAGLQQRDRRLRLPATAGPQSGTLLWLHTVTSFSSSMC